MTRQQGLGIEAARYLLTGIFQNIKSIEDPVVVERYETEVTYPHLKETKENQWVEKKAEIFEGLARRFFSDSSTFDSILNRILLSVVTV